MLSLEYTLPCVREFFGIKLAIIQPFIMSGPLLVCVIFWMVDTENWSVVRLVVSNMDCSSVLKDFYSES